MGPQSATTMMGESIFLNTAGKDWKFRSDDVTADKVLDFHRRLPYYNETPLHSLPSIAAELGVGDVLVKDESSRFGLPSFKILGASWAVYRAIRSALHLKAKGDQGSMSVGDLGFRAQQRNLKLLTTTEGNWGRAVARMAKYMGIPAIIYVPSFMPAATRGKLRSEGAELRIVDGNYDDCVATVQFEANNDRHLVLVMDMGWDGYEQIPQWVVSGYSTMLRESDRQVLEATGGRSATHAVVPVGVGSIAQAVTQHYKAREGTTVLTAEPDTAACLKTSIAAGEIKTVSTQNTIMCGMNCGTVSTTAWPILKAGVDACIQVQDIEAHRDVERLGQLGVRAGPCGASTLAALRRACAQAKDKLGLGSESVVVLYCTEGTREYEAPTSWI